MIATVKDTQEVEYNIFGAAVKEPIVDKLYTVHSRFNQTCTDFGVQTELLVSEDNLRVILTKKKPVTRLMEALRSSAIANGIIAESRETTSGTLVVIASDPKLNISSILNAVDTKFGKFYRDLNEAFETEPEKQEDDEDDEGEEEKGWERLHKAAKEWDEGKNPESLEDAIDEAFQGIAVPDGAAQPQTGVKMLKQALAARTQSGITLEAALKKAGISWHVAEPGSHVVVFKNKEGDEKWRVEPMTLSDKKVFETTLEALWSVALGKSPNAKELEREAAKQRAKELGDHQKEITGLVDQIIGKHTPTGQQAGEKNVAPGNARQ